MPPTAAQVFVGDSEMAARCRALDWSATPLGPVGGWSQSLRTIVSALLASRHPMFLWWGPHLVQIYNDGFLPSFGYAGRDVAALGACGREYWTEIWPVIGPQIDAVLTRGEATWHEDHLVPIERNGRVEDVYWTYGYSPVRDDDGGIRGVLVVVQETTARVTALAERERLLAGERSARAAAEAANRAKADFLTVMSHELRTPLNAIGGYVELMEMGVHGPVTGSQREDLARILTSQRHLLGLINEVLDYAKLETGSVRYDLADVVACDALSAAVELVSPQVGAKGLVVTVVECAPGLAVRADPERLRQILINLLSNAIKFTERGGTITLEAESQGEGGSLPPRVALRVRDSGIGIAANRLEAIFEAFVQVNPRSTRTHEGTGLGLTISRDLARGMAGDLAVDSEMGVGSTFTLTLPRA